ncbi:MAG: DUF59 domain-containing protein [Acidobacteriota bacterium]
MEENVKPQTESRASDRGTEAGNQESTSIQAGTGSPAEASQQTTQTTGSTEALKEKIVEMIKTCYDPEIPVNIWELGLVYKIGVDPSGAVAIDMTLTSPACPVAGSLPVEVENKVKSVEGVTSVKVDVVWEPVWTPEMMTEAARLQLGMF